MERTSIARTAAGIGLFLAVILAIPSAVQFIKEPGWVNILGICIMGALTLFVVITIWERKNHLVPSRDFILLKCVSSVALVITYVAMVLYAVPLMDTEWRDTIMWVSVPLYMVNAGQER